MAHGQVEQYEIDAYLGDAREQMTDEQHAEFSRYAKDNPEGDWNAKIQELLGES